MILVPYIMGEVIIGISKQYLLCIDANTVTIMLRKEFYIGNMGRYTISIGSHYWTTICKYIGRSCVTQCKWPTQTVDIGASAFSGRPESVGLAAISAALQESLIGLVMLFVSMIVLTGNHVFFNLSSSTSTFHC